MHSLVVFQVIRLLLDLLLTLDEVSFIAFKDPVIETTFMTAQVTALADLLKTHTLRRTRAEAGQTLNAKTEIQIPVSLTDRQADYYRQVLGRFYNALVDPKMHRLSSSRASQAKTICEELRKVSIAAQMTLSDKQASSYQGLVFGKLSVVFWQNIRLV